MRRTGGIMSAAFGVFLMVVLLSNASGPAKMAIFTGAPFNKGLTCAKAVATVAALLEPLSLHNAAKRSQRKAVTSYLTGQPPYFLK